MTDKQTAKIALIDSGNFSIQIPNRIWSNLLTHLMTKGRKDGIKFG